MKRLLVLAAMLSAPAFAQDKALHFGAGAAIASAVTLATGSASYGFTAGCAAGVLKEAYDARHPKTHTVSGKDLAITCLGAGLGAGATRWYIHRDNGTTTVTYNLTF